MPAAHDPERSLRLKTNVVKRVQKEYHMYVEEEKTNKERFDSLKEEGKDEYVLRKQMEVIAETQMMIPDTLKRLKTSYQALQGALAEFDGSESELVMEAKKYVESAKETCKSAQ